MPVLESVRDKGYAHTTARDVATASGANLASIGYHFRGMDALLEEVLVQCFAALPLVITALCDGLMLQWLADPTSTPSAAQTMDAREALSPLLALTDEPDQCSAL